jgi:hypothetical protein
MPRKYDIKELYKTAILGPTYMFREVLIQK